MDTLIRKPDFFAEHEEERVKSEEGQQREDPPTIDNLEVRPEFRPTETVIRDPSWIAPVPGPLFPDEVREGPQRNLKRTAIVLVSGLSLGVFLTFVMIRNRNTELAPIAPDSTNTFRIEAVASAPSDTQEKALGFTTGADRQRTQKELYSKSDMIEHVTGQAVPLQKRRFLALTGSQRGHDPLFVIEDQVSLGESSDPTDFQQLRKVPGEYGRYQSDLNSAEFQAGWKFGDPTKNIELGTAYQQYLQKNFGSGVFDRMMSVKSGSSKLLPKTGKPLNIPTQVKSYGGAP